LSINQILLINQFNVKEHLDHIKYILKDRFESWISIIEKVISNNFNIDFFDMYDTKFSYMILQCLSWSHKYHPFCRCKYKYSEAFTKGKCSKLLSKDYKILRN